MKNYVFGVTEKRSGKNFFSNILIGIFYFSVNKDTSQGKSNLACQYLQVGLILDKTSFKQVSRWGSLLESKWATEASLLQTHFIYFIFPIKFQIALHNSVA